MKQYEKDLYFLWEVFCRQGLHTSDRRLSGLNPGKANRFAGPDYLGAEFELDGRVYRGDVEIHLKPADWYAHQHHLDYRYNQVLLHLVWEPDGEVCILNSFGRPVPTLSLRSFPRLQKAATYVAGCRWHKRKPASVSEILKDLSRQRLSARHKSIREIGASVSFDQTLFLMFLRVLGQPQNAANFFQLGIRLAWEELIRIRDRHRFTSAHWLTLFSVQSGLIDCVPALDHLQFLKPQIEAAYSRSTLADDGLVWHLSGQRPYNNPVHHLKLLSCWLHWFPQRSLYMAIKEILTGRLPDAGALRALGGLFSPVLADSSPGAIKLWGMAKVNEIIGNVILPFFHLEASRQGSQGFKYYLESLYLFLPQTQTYARLRWLYQLEGLQPLSANRFYVNQALLYLDDQYCRVGRCQVCPFEIKDKGVDKSDENN